MVEAGGTTGDRSGKPGKTAFFLTKFDENGSSRMTRADALLESVVEPAAASYGLLVSRADLAARPGRLSLQAIEGLLGATVVICDLTGRSPSVYYELGVAHACNLPTILLVDDAEDLPFYVKDEHVIVTGPGVPDADATQTAAAELTRSIAHVLRSEAFAGSIVGEMTGISGLFPVRLRDAIWKSASPLYRDALEYVVQIRDVGEDHLDARVSLSYRLVNRSRRDQTQVVGLVPMRPLQPVHARIGSGTIGTDNPDFLTQRGWQIPHVFKGGSTTNVEFVADVSYRMPDTDVFATYLPATSFLLQVEYPADKVRVVAESLLPYRVEPERLSRGAMRFVPPEAVLAYQGFKLDWLRPDERTV